ncbi:hypothetical protein BCON_0261g00200 [Botryotinia convoluta]|uniref:Uncharacterized protein n=1 Tax=Botryotinia convoluta TaxID=54673 RepID=A0A4Z1HS99_9HELO|nr:hypothetical protein BCON_0261g00200 [Botryotinia convoluta]
MASDLSTLAENDTFSIKLKNSESLSEVLHLKLQEAPEPWMRLQGSHSITNPETSQREQVIDFAVKIKGLNTRLIRVELRGDEGHDLEAIPMDKRDENSSIFDEEVIQRSCQAVVDLANKGYYKGEQPRRQQTWLGRLKAAMVDNEQGWIDKNDPIPGGIRFTRALKKFDLVSSIVRTASATAIMQEFERAAILGATARPGNSVTLIHRPYVPSALVSRIKILELANNGARARRAEQESKLAFLANRIQSLESRLRNREQQLESQAIEIKTLQTEIIGLSTSQGANMITLTRHDHLIKNHHGFLENRAVKHINSVKEASESQKIKSDDQERELDEKLALYQSILMENQERELNEKLASYEANLLQKVKQIILAELLGLETQSGAALGGKSEPHIVCSPNIYGFDGQNSSQAMHSISKTTLTTY